MANNVLVNSVTNSVANTIESIYTAPPNGTIITSVIVHGNAGATEETWDLNRADFAGSKSEMATANIGTADTSITNPTIDNENFQYYIRTSTLDTADSIFGAIITYISPLNKQIIMRVR